jgi:hypothetical protein
LLEPQSAIEAIRRAASLVTTASLTTASLVTNVIEISIYEDLYFAQITGRSSVLRRGLAAHFFPEERGLPKVGWTS